MSDNVCGRGVSEYGELQPLGFCFCFWLWRWCRRPRCGPSLDPRSVVGQCRHSPGTLYSRGSIIPSMGGQTRPGRDPRLLAISMGGFSRSWELLVGPTNQVGQVARPLVSRPEVVGEVDICRAGLERRMISIKIDLASSASWIYHVRSGMASPVRGSAGQTHHVMVHKARSYLVRGIPVTQMN
jgi:hypothetical protein